MVFSRSLFHGLKQASLWGVLLFLVVAACPVGAAPLQDAATFRPAHRTTMHAVAAVELGEQLQALVTGGDETADLEPQETFGTRALGLLLGFVNLLHDQTVSFVTRISAFPEISSWVAQQALDANLSARWLLIGQRLVMVVGGGLLASWLIALLLLPIRRRIKRREIHSLGARIGLLIFWFLINLIPLIVFLATTAALMDQGEASKLIRYFVMTVVYALTIFSFVRLLVRFLVAPRTPQLRLIPVTTPQASYIQKWISGFAGVMVLGFFLPDIARLVRMPAVSITTFNSFIGLVITLMTITVILQKRSVVSTFLRGNLSAAQQTLSLWESMRLWLARSWHVLAIAYLVVGYIVTTISAGGGFALMQQGTILTLLVLLAMRLSFYLAARIGFSPTMPDVIKSSSILRPVLRTFVRVLAWAFGVAGIAAAWGVDVSGIVMSPWGQRVLGSIFSIGSTILLVVVIYEALHTAINRNLNKHDENGQSIESNARARTLLPMLHNAAIIVLVIIVGLVTLSELGINIAPLLAGAGVLGVAVGFGSQTLIKDFLTGLFIILENTVAVGDIVSIGDSSGVVEGITIRTARLRAFNGDLHILPFSEITRVVNMTKGFAYAVLDMGVAYDSDLSKVMDVMREAGAALQKDPVLGTYIIEPIEISGVESFNDSSITVRGRLKTRPGKQWDVKRGFNLLIKQHFDAAGINIPFPTVMQIRQSEPPAHTVPVIETKAVDFVVSEADGPACSLEGHRPDKA